MSYWSEAPLVRLFPPFVVGIICGLYFNLDTTWILSAIIIIIALLWILIKGFRWKYSTRWLFGITTYVAIFLIGFYITENCPELRKTNHFSKYTTDKIVLFAHINEQPQEKTNSIKVLVEVEALFENNKQLSSRGKLLIYLPKDSITKSLRYGDCLALNTKIDTIQAPLNPHEFDYKKYLSFRNIYHRAFVKNDQWVKINENHGWWLKRWAYDLREKLLNIFRQHLSGNEYTVAASLIAGYVDDIDRDLITAYANTGVLHVLSVSGMHVAIIYIAISRLLSFTEKRKITNIVKNILVILFLWFYACITGFSPAVLRATFMLTLVVIGKIIDRESNIYNSLAASALILLFVNPYLIADIGFQLSYLSLVGIVALQPSINNLLTPNNRIFNYVWELTSTSVAAQIAVLPISLYYFQRFPNYFIPANFFVIPLSTVAIYSGILLLLVSPIGMLSKLLGKLTWISVKALNSCVFWFNALPGAVLSGLYLNLSQTLLFYITIILLISFFYFKKYHFFFASLISYIFLLIIANYQSFQNSLQQKIIVYAIPKSTAIDFINGKKSLIINNENFSQSKNNYNYHIAGNHNHYGVGEVRFSSIQDSAISINFWRDKNVMQIHDKRILIVENNKFTNIKKPAEPIKLDYIILSGNSKISITDLASIFQPKKIIADLSNSRYFCKKWEKECEKLNLPWYDIATQGAFINAIND